MALLALRQHFAGSTIQGGNKVSCRYGQYHGSHLPQCPVPTAVWLGSSNAWFASSHLHRARQRDLVDSGTDRYVLHLIHKVEIVGDLEMPLAMGRQVEQLEPSMPWP